MRIWRSLIVVAFFAIPPFIGALAASAAALTVIHTHRRIGGLFEMTVPQELRIVKIMWLSAALAVAVLLAVTCWELR
jgi:hypothetical protein